MDSLFEQSGVVQETAMPVRREGDKPTSKTQNLETKKSLLHSTKTKSCNGVLNSSFSPLLTSANFGMKTTLIQTVQYTCNPFNFHDQRYPEYMKTVSKVANTGIKNEDLVKTLMK